LPRIAGGQRPRRDRARSRPGAADRPAVRDRRAAASQEPDRGARDAARGFVLPRPLRRPLHRLHLAHQGGGDRPVPVGSHRLGTPGILRRVLGAAMDIRVNGDRLWSSLMEMAELGALPGGGSCRLALTDADVDARDLFVKWCREAGCDIAIDQAGNIFATRPGRNADAPAIATGSHLDTQPHGGRFDGVLGVLAGLEVVRTLNDAGIETEKPVAAVNWTNEEGVRFPRGILGSAAYIGAIDVDSLHALQSTDGHVLGDELRRSGYLGDLAPGAFPMERFYEVHIEQGPELE